MTNDKLDELLNGKEPEERLEVNVNREFKPKINVREEFVLWIREQFPELGEYIKKGGIYKSLETREEEIYQAALGAVNHGLTSTEDCASTRLHSGWVEFEKGFGVKGNPRRRAKSLGSFVKALEDLSISLGGDKHYTMAGKFLNGKPYSDYLYRNLRAFVYMVGEENGKDTKYLVFDVKQKFEGNNIPVLIGELRGLSKWDFESLGRIASKFQGTEIDFIEKVDKLVPQKGSYDYSHGYYGSVKYK